MKRALLAAAVLFASLLGARAEQDTITITKQPGISYLPAILMEQKGLIEKHAAAIGIPDLKTRWASFSNGGAATDALLSGNVDFVTTGITNFILVWSATNGGVKAAGALARVPMMLVTRNPKVRSLADFTETDRIAVPNTKAASQIILLQMMLEKQFGEGSYGRLNPLLVQLGHPEAVQALSNPRHEVNSHLSAPPYQDEELKMPGIHKVVTLTDVTGGPSTNTVVFSSDKFARANPRIMQAFVAALDEANDFIRTNPREAAELYLVATKEKSSVGELAAFLQEPTTTFSTAPAGALTTAQFMHKIGITRKQASDWRDLFFPELHGRDGN